MSTLTNVEQTEFDALVKIEYHSRGFILRDSVRMRTDVVGSSCQFRKVGQVVANAVAFQNTIAIQDPNFTAFTASLVKYAAGTAVDEIQDLTVNFDTKRELAMVVAMAIGRRSDQIIINSFLNAASTTIGGVGSNYTYSNLRNLLQLFDENAVPIGERFNAMSGNNLRALMSDDHIVSRFFTSNDLVVNGSIDYKELMSMNIRIIPTMIEGGLPLNGTIRSTYAWHKMSTGMAIGQDMRTEVNYLPRETSWFVNGLFYAGAIVVDNLGLYEVDCDESVNP